MSTSPQFATRPLRVESRTHVPLVAAALLLLFGIATVLYSLAQAHRLLHAGAAGSLFAVLMGGLAASMLGLGGVLLSLVVPRTRARVCAIAASGGTLTVDGVELAARIAGARIEEDLKRGGWAVSIFTGARSPAVIVHVPAQEDAKRLAAAVTPRVTDALLSFRFPVGRTRAGSITAIILFVGIAMAALLVAMAKVATPLALLALTPAFVLYLVPVQVKVGADGLALRWIGPETFVPFAMVEDARVEGRALVLSLRGGRKERLLGVGRDDVAGARALDALAGRMQQHRASGASSSVVLRERLAVCSRTDADAWIAELRAIAAGSYREIALSPGALWAVLEDASSEENARIAAAALLRGGLDDSGVARLRAIVSGAASESLRDGLAWVAQANPLRSADATQGPRR